jgi:ribosomal protein L11 methyltransferase
MEVFSVLKGKSQNSLLVEVPFELEDELAGWLSALGSVGSWSEPAGAGRCRLRVFFAAGTEPECAELERRLAGFSGVTVSAATPLEERDWLAAWRQSATPIPVGARFLVDPREPADVRLPAAAGDRILLRLPARTAFGVGSHESTRLALELLEATPVAGKRVLDVGTGTGILAFAALHLGAAAVLACDLDPTAALLLPQTMALNGHRFAAWAGTLQALSCSESEATESTEGKDGLDAGRLAPGRTRGAGRRNAKDRRFDLALVNVIPEEIAPDLDRLAAALQPGGLALFSGILSERLEDAIARVGRHGLRHPPHARRQAGGPPVVEAGEWAAFAAERIA